MIQSGSFLSVIDNSGAKSVICIKVLSGYKRRYAFVGDLIMVSIKNLRSQRRASSKAKKGEIYKALVVRIKTKVKIFNSDTYSFFENSVVLLSKQNKCVGTRVFGILPKSFRFSKFLKIVSISSGVLK